MLARFLCAIVSMIGVMTQGVWALEETPQQPEMNFILDKRLYQNIPQVSENVDKFCKDVLFGVPLNTAEMVIISVLNAAVSPCYGLLVLNYEKEKIPQHQEQIKQCILYATMLEMLHNVLFVGFSDLGLNRIISDIALGEDNPITRSNNE